MTASVTASARFGRSDGLPEWRLLAAGHTLKVATEGNSIEVRLQDPPLRIAQLQPRRSVPPRAAKELKHHTAERIDAFRNCLLFS